MVKGYDHVVSGDLYCWLDYAATREGKFLKWQGSLESFVLGAPRTVTRSRTTSGAKAQRTGGCSSWRKVKPGGSNALSAGRHR